jgi:hypothetical protein
VYRLDLVPEAIIPANFNKADAVVRLTLELKINPVIGECLELVPGSVQLFYDPALPPLDGAHLVRLRLCTMMDNTFWLDSPSFEVDAKLLFAGL